MYAIDLEKRSIASFSDFNDFYTRELPRTIDMDESFWVIPCDSNMLLEERLLEQNKIHAKNKYFLLQDLLVDSMSDCIRFNGGVATTFKLEPYNSHRVVAPYNLSIIKYKVIPGRFYATDINTLSKKENILSYNHRVVVDCLCCNNIIKIVLVGSVLANTIVLSGLELPASGVFYEKTLETPLQLSKGDLLAKFNSGSMVIVIKPPELKFLNKVSELPSKVIIGQRWLAV